MNDEGVLRGRSCSHWMQLRQHTQHLCRHQRNRLLRAHGTTLVVPKRAMRTLVVHLQVGDARVGLTHRILSDGRLRSHGRVQHSQEHNRRRHRATDCERVCSHLVSERMAVVSVVAACLSPLPEWSSRLPHEGDEWAHENDSTDICSFPSLRHTVGEKFFCTVYILRAECRVRGIQSRWDIRPLPFTDDCDRDEFASDNAKQKPQCARSFSCVPARFVTRSRRSTPKT